VEITDPILTPVAADTDPINCTDSKVVTFHYTHGTTEVRGYSVRVSCSAELSFGAGDVVFNDVPGGLVTQSYVDEITPGRVYDVDYVILGGSTGIAADYDLFTVTFDGTATGAGVVSMTDVSLAAMDGLPIMPVDYSGTAGIAVDCTPPAGTFVINNDDTYTTVVGVTLNNGITDANPPIEMEFSNDDATYSGYVAYAATPSWDLAAGDGLKTVYAHFRDALGNVFSTSDDITLDGTAPATSVDALGTYQVDSFFDVTYTIDLEVGSGVASVELYYQLNDGGYVLYPGGPYTGSPISFTHVGDGDYDFYTRATDNAGNLEDAPGAADASTLVDRTAPATSVDALWTYQVDSFFDVTYTIDLEEGSGFASVELYYQLDDGGYVLYPGGPYTASPISFTHVGDGDYDFYTRATDNAGNVEDAPGAADASTTVDTSGPDVTAFEIDGGATYALSTSVQLSWSVTGATSMQFMNEGGSWSGWVPINAGPMAWMLDSSDGTKTVYAQFRDAALIVTDTNDDIILDENAPGPVTGLTATRGNGKVTLGWTNPDEGETGLEVWRAVWHDGDDATSAYPEYDDLDFDEIPTRRSRHLLLRRLSRGRRRELGRRRGRLVHQLPAGRPGRRWRHHGRARHHQRPVPLLRHRGRPASLRPLLRRRSHR